MWLIGVAVLAIGLVATLVAWTMVAGSFITNRDWWTWSGWTAMAALAALLAAIGTVGFLFFLGIQAWRLGQQTNELRRQNDEEAKARRQDDERRRAEAENDRWERHLAQARLVAALVGPRERSSDDSPFGRSAIDLVNGSDEPVYRLVVGIVCLQGTCPHSLEAWLEYQQRTLPSPGPRLVPITTVSILPKGTWQIWVQGSGWSGVLSGRAGAEVAFEDRAGSHWIRRATGQLEELDQEPFEYFTRLGMWGPHDLQTPERLV